MTYELAKELKDAGFSLEGNRWKYILESGYLELAPTLSELIEACMGYQSDQPNFSALVRQVGNWKATSTRQIEGIGATPEEAVARLWLALNKKSEPAA